MNIPIIFSNNLKLLNSDKTKVLFQKTKDKRVVNFLKKKF